MSNNRTVYIVDDDDPVKESLSLALELAGYRVAAFSSSLGFLAESTHLAPGCIILDVRMPEMDGLELQEQLTAKGIRFPVIVMTGHGDIAIAVQAMKAGAVDFMEKPFSKETLLDLVGAAFVRLEDASASARIDAVSDARIARLSKRERQVLEGLVRGLPNKTIAYDLSVSPRTVEVYRARLMDKMMVSTFADLVRLALAAGIAPGKE